MGTSAKEDENWSKTTDVRERRRIQNRLAQRNYRNNIKQRLKQLDEFDKAFSKGILTVGNIRDESEEEEVFYQQQPNDMTYPITQPMAPRSDNNCTWLSNPNDLSMTGHPEIPLDMTGQLESTQYNFGLTTPNTNRSPSPHSQSPTEPHANLAFDRPPTTQAALPWVTPPQQYTPQHQRAPSRSTKSETQAFNVGLIPIPNAHPQPSPSSSQVFGMPTPPTSEPMLANAGTRLRSSTGGSGGGSSASTKPIIAQYPTGAAASGTPLHQAAANGHLQIVRFLVLRGASLTSPNEASQTVLHLAAERGHEEVIEHALAQAIAAGAAEGRDVKTFIDWVDDQGFTALHRAAAGGHEECVRVLVEAGAELDSLNARHGLGALAVSPEFSKCS